MDALFVLGMHRSGTSCLVGCLEACGLYLGSVSRREGVAGNAGGTLEPLGVNDLDEELIRSWLRPRLPVAPRRRTLERIAACVREMEERAARDGATRIGIKDPRMLLTLPFWRGHFGAVQLVGTFRNPGAVHASLMARRDFGVRKAANLRAWKLYNRALLDWCAREDVRLVSYDAPAERYLARLRGLCAETGLAWDEAAVARRFDPGLRRQREVSCLDDAEAREIYEALVRLAAGQEPAGEAAAT